MCMSKHTLNVIYVVHIFNSKVHTTVTIHTNVCFHFIFLIRLINY